MPHTHSLPIPLSRISIGERVVLVQLNMPKTSANRLLSLGFTPGVEISITQNYGRGPMVVYVRGARVALGRSEASDILVKQENP